MRHTALALALGGVFASAVHADPLPQFVGDTVVVTPTRFESATLPTPAHLVVITREDIERTPATNIPDLLAGVPGAAVIPLYGALGIDATASLRGAGSGGTATSNTLVLLNGQRLNPVDSGSIDWSLIPLASIERIEVMPGSGTVLYGDRASGGVINVITRKSTNTGYVSLGGGSHGLREAGIQAGGMAGPIDASLYFQYGESDGWRDNSDQRRYALGGAGSISWTGTTCGPTSIWPRSTRSSASRVGCSAPSTRPIRRIRVTRATGPIATASESGPA